MKKTWLAALGVGIGLGLAACGSGPMLGAREESGQGATGFGLSTPIPQLRARQNPERKVEPVMEFSSQGPWLNDDGPDTEVVMSCRVRLARNIAGFPFVGRLTDSQRQDVVNIAQQVVLTTDLAEGMIWVDLAQATARDRQLQMERHLISRNLAEADYARAVAVSGDESLSIMINEEDHLRMQLLAPGRQLADLVERINGVDDTIETKVDYAFSPRWG